jgi:hypothetical protein
LLIEHGRIWCTAEGASQGADFGKRSTDARLPLNIATSEKMVSKCVWQGQDEVNAPKRILGRCHVEIRLDLEEKLARYMIRVSIGHFRVKLPRQTSSQVLT